MQVGQHVRVQPELHRQYVVGVGTEAGSDLEVDRSGTGRYRPGLPSCWPPVSLLLQVRSSISSSGLFGIAGKISRLVDCLRRVAAISDRAVRSGLAAAGVGMNETEMAATTDDALGQGVGEDRLRPLVRSSETLQEEHTT